MRKDRVYKLNVPFNAASCDINGAECPGGRRPSTSCKHIAALCVN